MSMKNKPKGYLLTVALLILAMFAVYFYFIKKHINHLMLQERKTIIAYKVSYVCETVNFLVERDEDWGEYDYLSTLVFLTEKIDGEKDVYAELFDEQLNGLSRRITHTDDLVFYLEDYPDLIERVKVENDGQAIVKDYNRGKRPPHDVCVAWRWIPTDETYQHRFLLIAGVSKFSIIHTPEEWIDYGVIALFGLSSGVILCGIMRVTAESREKTPFRRYG